jgi:hypothetical protein
MLVTRAPSTGSPQILLAGSDGADGQVLTNGTEPVWLPNGEEFLFNVDSAHVGVFSLPTMSYTLLPNARGRYPQRTAVSEKGDAIAVLYTETADLERAIDVLAFPDLTVAASYNVPWAVHSLQFRGGGLLLSTQARSSALQRLDWRTGRSRAIGLIPDSSVESVLRVSDVENLVVSVTKQSDIWLAEPGGAERALTHDGRDFWASTSPSGDVLIARLLADGRYVVVLHDAHGDERQLTSGPLDVSPSFGKDGKTWLYYDYQRKAIMRCDASACAEVLRDPRLMAWPTPSPDDRQIAFVTVEGTPHLKITDAGGADPRDFGPTTWECPPVWTSANALWAFSGSGDKREWREIDVVSGKKTGRVKVAPGIGPDEPICDVAGEPADSPFYRPARVVSRERWDVLRTHAIKDLGID